MASPKLLDKAQDPRLDRYELIGEIASGGMATVFLARLAGVGGFQRFVAIKRLHPHLSNETEFVQMFLDEARLAASIHHPHVVPILEVGTSQAGYYVVMEYIEGDTLAGMLAREAGRGSRIPTRVAMRIALDTLAGLHAAHELRDDDGNLVNLVHRDVSPQNVLVGVDGSARITDFGVARASSRLASTRSGTLKGKLAYMPPEQAKGEAFIDQRCDVFAMGVVLWECLAGRRLFKGDTELETLTRLMFEPIPTVRKFAPEVPESIEQVLVLALERDMDKRYRSAAEFADALERAGEGAFPIASVRETAAYVQDLIGQQIQQQRAAVKAWLATEPSQGVKPSNFSQIVASDRMPDSTAAARRPTPLPPAPSGDVMPRVSVPAPLASSKEIGALIPLAEPSQRVAAPEPGPVSNTDAGAFPSERRPSVTPPAATQPAVLDEAPRRKSAAWVAPVVLLALGGAAYFGWTLMTAQDQPSSAASLMPTGTTQPALAAELAERETRPTASAEAAASAERRPSEPAATTSLSVDALPAADAKPTAPVVAPRGKAAPAAKKTTEPAAAPPVTPTPAPVEPKPAAADGYKNPYR